MSKHTMNHDKTIFEHKNNNKAKNRGNTEWDVRVATHFIILHIIIYIQYEYTTHAQRTWMWRNWNNVFHADKFTASHFI